MARVLVVANKTAATPGLLDAVRERAGRGDAQFTLLVPNAHGGLNKITAAEHDMEADEAQQVIALAKPLIEEAAGSEIETLIGDPNPLDAIQDAVNVQGFDEIIISTLPTPVSRWLHLDLPSKLNGLGLPVTTVTAKG
jgi:hypothetical protein